MKAKILLDAFFPPSPTVDLSDIIGCQYDQSLTTGEITKHKIHRAITLTPSKKAPGDDEITSGILLQITDIITPYLHRIFNACLEEGYCPEHFRNAVIIALRKPGKSTYRVAGSYRPIALLNTIAKLQEFILARRISYLA